MRYVTEETFLKVIAKLMDKIRTLESNDKELVELLKIISEKNGVDYFDGDEE